LVIADVSDKGMGAALFMTLTRSTVRASVASKCSPADCISHANALITADAVNAMFVTLFYAQLDPTSGELIYVNAGHNPPLYYSAKRHAFTPLARTGLALGVSDTSKYEQRSIILEPDDFLLLYTDGVTEAPDAQEEPFGDERLLRVAWAHPGATAAAIVAAVETALHDFTGGEPPFDDITMVAVKRI
jgi:sigma-B regulation protein RsbU (phosphoserine phosphatase)